MHTECSGVAIEMQPADRHAEPLEQASHVLESSGRTLGCFCLFFLFGPKPCAACGSLLCIFQQAGNFSRLFSVLRTFASPVSARSRLSSSLSPPHSSRGLSSCFPHVNLRPCHYTRLLISVKNLIGCAAIATHFLHFFGTFFFFNPHKIVHLG